MRVIYKLSAGFLVLVLLTLCVLRFGVLRYIDWQHNAVILPEPYVVSDRTRAFHHAAFVADMHADSLLWGRDLSERHSRGHIDVPRLLDGGVDLQVFSVVTKVPSPLSYDANHSDTDSLPLLFLASWRHPATWFNPKERALAQARELTRLADKTPLTLVLRRSDLSTEGVKGLLALEGMHALGNGDDALIEFYSAGFRMMGLVHFFDNKIGGSVHGTAKYGLTERGRSLIPRMEALGITVDLAHASAAAIGETLGIATKPVVVSHTGVRGTCQIQRNLSDAQLRGVARNGGVVGIGYWKRAVCDASLQGIVAAILYAIKVAGIDHVGLGSDFDGNISAPFDTTGLPILTGYLFAAGLSEEDVGKVLGGNVRRVLSTNLPE
jgi:membrane dipeptidase